MLRRWHRELIASAFACFGPVCALAAADRANPPDLSRYENVSPEVVDRNGVLLRPFLSQDGYWRLRTYPRDVDPRYLQLLKAYEDKRFDDHFGVDPVAIARAALQYAASGHIVSGASTLSMQAARLLDAHPTRTVGAKIAQMVRAVQLEERLSKDRVLSIYLTLAPFGGNLEGVRAASLAYFGKEPSALTLSQAATLVSIPQSPEAQRPDRHAIRAKRGRDHVLARMVEDGALTTSDAAVAQREGVASQRLAMPLIAPHFAEHLVLTHRARRIVTTIDAPLQQAVERMAARERSYFDDASDIAIVVVENKSRSVRAYLGGVDYWGKEGQIDLANRPRSPGSALKPFIYGLAFDDLVLHPLTMMTDEPTLFGDYAPRDFSGSFQGAVTARDALRMSLNVPAVMVLDRVGPLRFTLALTNAGANLAFPVKDDAPSLPVALGGLGISLRDITMLYAGIANGGVAESLRTRADAPEGAKHRMFGPVAAYYLRQILDGVSLPEGWAMGQGLKRKRTIGFKTGTSYGFRDAWSVGFSNDYTVGVWVGRADGAPYAGRVGVQAAAPLLLRTFELLPPDKSPDPQVPAGALMVTSTDRLPPSLQVFQREESAPAPQAVNVPAPTISFPPNGATVPIPDGKDGNKTIQLKADGGRGPLTWLVDGQLLGSFDRFSPVLLDPPGEGYARITVVDSRGLSDTSKVLFRRER